MIVCLVPDVNIANGIFVLLTVEKMLGKLLVLPSFMLKEALASFGVFFKKINYF